MFNIREVTPANSNNIQLLLDLIDESIDICFEKYGKTFYNIQENNFVAICNQCWNLDDDFDQSISVCLTTLHQVPTDSYLWDELATCCRCSSYCYTIVATIYCEYCKSNGTLTEEEKQHDRRIIDAVFEEISESDSDEGIGDEDTYEE